MSFVAALTLLPKDDRQAWPPATMAILMFRVAFITPSCTYETLHYRFALPCVAL